MHTSSAEYRRTLVRTLREVDIGYDLIVEVLHGLTQKEPLDLAGSEESASREEPPHRVPASRGSDCLHVVRAADQPDFRSYRSAGRTKCLPTMPAWLRDLDRGTARALLLAGFGSTEEVTTAFWRGDLAEKLGANRIGAVQVWLARMPQYQAKRVEPDMAMN